MTLMIISLDLPSREIAAGGSRTLFVDHTVANKGLISLIQTIVAFMPLVVYVMVSIKKGEYKNEKIV